MTGHGEARRERDGISVAVEVRTINNKYFKLSLRTSERDGSLEPQVESLVRQHVRRGTVQVGLWVEREPTADDFRLNEDVLEAYHRQLTQLENRLGGTHPIRLESLLSLPGVVVERQARRVELSDEWPIVEETLAAALKHLALMREDEGRAMAADLRLNARLIASQLEAIAKQAPQVVESYRGRIVERLNKVLSEFQVTLTAADVAREVGMFAERVDISEEIVRLRSHLQQFDQCLELAESQGRKLEFLIQEMFREANTIGSKANDATLAQHVIEIKSAIERMREMIQNVE